VVNLPAEFVPHLGNALPVVPVLDDGLDNRSAARGFGLDPLQLAELLAGSLDRVGDLQRNFFAARSRIRSDDERFLDREFWVFEPTEFSVSHDSASEDEGHRHEYHSVVLDGENSGIHGWPAPRASPKSRTFIPSRKNGTPATAIRSPGCSPSTISIWLP